MSRFITALTILASLAAGNALTQQAGYYIEETVINTSSGEASDSNRVKMWICGDRFRRVQEDSSEITIGRIDKGIFWVISPKEKTYSVLDLETIRQMAKITLAMMGAQIDDEGNLTIPGNLYIKTGRKDTVGLWVAEEVSLNPKYSNMGFMESFSMWVSQDCGVPPEIYANMMRSLLGDPQGGAKKLFKLWKDLDGYPVKIEMQMMGMKQTTITHKIEEREIPDEKFQLPQGLTEVVHPLKEAFERMMEK